MVEVKHSIMTKVRSHWDYNVSISQKGIKITRIIKIGKRKEKVFWIKSWDEMDELFKQHDEIERKQKEVKSHD